jgi:predicted TIM-barrel fold metal-dependent hydrolase
MRIPARAGSGRGNFTGEIRSTERRTLLRELAVLGGSALIPASRLLAQAASAADARRIDVHHHFASPGWIAALKANNALAAAWNTWTPAKSIEAMDKAGTATGIASITTPGIWFGEGFENSPAKPGPNANEDARKLARETNEYGAKLISDYQGRFGIWAALPLMDVEGSLREIEYSLDTLKLDGIGLLTSYGNRWLGDPMFAPLFEELNRRKAVVFIHPTAAPCCRELQPNVGAATIEYNTDTSRTVVSWITSGAAAKFPDVTMIFSHAGGTIPYLIERIIGANEGGGPAGIADLLSNPAKPNSKLYYLRRFYYDTAQSSNPVQMQALKMVAGASQIVFGTDYPYAPMVDHVQGLQKCGFTPGELRGIDRENIARVVPHYNKA